MISLQYIILIEIRIKKSDTTMHLIYEFKKSFTINLWILEVIVNEFMICKNRKIKNVYPKTAQNVKELKINF